MSESLYCISFSPKRPKNISEPLYNSTYNMWINVWRDSYKYFGWDPNQVLSDQWMRQDLILGVYQGNTPVGVVFFDEKNLTNETAYDDSYFRMWPRELLKEISTWPSANKALISSYFTLSSHFRKKANGIDYKGLLHGLALKQFVELGHKFMIGTMVKQSMSKLSFEHGAQILKSDVEEKGLLVDLLYWDQNKMQLFKFPELHEQIQKIWYSENYQQDLRKVA